MEQNLHMESHLQRLFFSSFSSTGFKFDLYPMKSVLKKSLPFLNSN